MQTIILIEIEENPFFSIEQPKHHHHTNITETK